MASASRLRTGKRKKKVDNPNPFFVKWLTDWKVEAETNGWKSAYTYGRALSSLKKYPLPLETGADCKVLMSFGPKICKMLDERLKEHKESGAQNIDEDNDLGSILASDRPHTSASSSRSLSAGSHSTPNSESPQKSSSKSPAGRGKKKELTDKRKTSRGYVPALRSGAYGLLIALYKYCQVEDKGNYLSKTDLIRLAQPHCDKSYTVPDTGSYYTAFSSMATLINKGLITKCSCPVKYQLTVGGCELSASLMNVTQPQNTLTTSLTSPEPVQSQSKTTQSKTTKSPTKSTAVRASQKTTSKAVETGKAKTKSSRIGSYSLEDEIQRMGQTPLSTSSSNQNKVRSNIIRAVEPEFTLPPGTYEIVLIVDSREHFGFGRAKQQILPSLSRQEVKFDVRPLSVGDFLWVARELTGRRRELVLDFCIERKRLDDLSGSIVDGRYKEQKMRLKQCGCRKLIYLIEHYKNQANEKIKEDTLLQAIINTQIIDDMYIKRCDNIIETMSYLGDLHFYIKEKYQLKTLHGYSRYDLPEVPFDIHHSEMCQVTFEDFQSGSVKSKTLTVGDMWQRMLMVVPNLSIDKAVKITETVSQTYAGTVALLDNRTTKSNKQAIFADLKSGDNNRRLGDALARNIVHLLHTAEPLT